MSPARPLRSAALAALASLPLAACADLATESGRVPGVLQLDSPNVLVTEGRAVKLGVRLLDLDGRPFTPLPAWARPVWSVSSGGVLETDGSTIQAVRSGAGLATVTLAGRSARATVRVNPREMVLRVERLYLTQSTQRADGSVPLVAGRDALLRVFLSGDRANFFEPSVRATLYRAGVPVQVLVLRALEDSVPRAIDEGVLRRSWNARIPAGEVTPGLSLVVEADPDGAVPEAAGSRTRYPETGALPLDVRSVPSLRLRVVPIELIRRGVRARLTANDLGALGKPAFGKFPLSKLDAELREPYATDADVGTANGWAQLLEEVAALAVADGSDRGYYGVLPRLPGSPWAGLGFLGYPAAIGDDDPESRGETMAHELGHNFGLAHAPCGNPANPDPAFPYEDGGIGVYGYDLLGSEVEDPAVRKDLMSYCRPAWISDYNYEKVLAFRGAGGGAAGRGGAPREPALLLWGAVVGGRLVLEPAFELEMRPRLPQAGGPYRLTGYDGAGAVLFTYAFAAARTDHAPGGAFAFAVPSRLAGTSRLERVVLEGPEGRVERVREPLGPRPTVSARGAGGGASLSWTEPGRPMALVRDTRTGEVLSIARGGSTRVSAPAGSVEVLLSDGVRSVRALALPPR